jgi:hypothetical protein
MIMNKMGSYMPRFVIPLCLLLLPAAWAFGDARPGTREVPKDVPKDVIVEIDGDAESVHLADLDGDGLKDLIVMASVGEPFEKIPAFHIFFQVEGDFEPADIPRETLSHVFLGDVGNFTSDPGEEMVLLSGDSGSLLRFDRKREVTIIENAFSLNSLFHAPAHQAPHLLEFSVDCDGNGYEDFIAPTPKGYAVLRSRGDGTFEEALYLPDTSSWSVQFSDNAFFSLMTLTSKLYALPYGDGNPLLVSVIKGKLLAHRFISSEQGFLRLESQRADFGSFTSERKAGSIEYAGIVFSDRQTPELPYFVRSIREGKPGILAALKTTHTIFGFKVNEKLNSVEAGPLQRIVTDGVASAPIFSDLNADGYEDLILMYVKTTILTKILEFLLDRVVVTCQAHLFEPDQGRFTFTPDWLDDVSMPTKNLRLVGTEGLILFNADYTGDGRPDMAVFDYDRLLFRRGERDEGLFSDDEISFRDRPFFQIGSPFPGPLFSENIDGDDCPEIITYGSSIVRIVHVDP